MKLKYEFVIKEAAGTLVALTAGKSSGRFNGMIKLNGIGKFIFEQLSNETTEEDIGTKVLEEYDGDEETAKSSVRDFIAKLDEGGLIEK